MKKPEHAKVASMSKERLNVSIVRSDINTDTTANPIKVLLMSDDADRYFSYIHNLVKPNTSTFRVDLACNSCGWSVITVCCNDEMAATEPYKQCDYWAYCSNKACKNHEGEEFGEFGSNQPFYKDK